MFEKIKELVGKLEESEFATYKERLAARKVLQAIKVEAQELRVKLNEMSKS